MLRANGRRAGRPLDCRSGQNCNDNDDNNRDQPLEFHGGLNKVVGRAPSAATRRFNCHLDERHGRGRSPAGELAKWRRQSNCFNIFQRQHYVNRRLQASRLEPVARLIPLG